MDRTVRELPIGIIGGGILGLALGRELTARHPGREVVVFEKEDRLAAHQTGRNSGVVHAGIYYRPGSLKAQLCTRGRTLLREYCTERDLPYDQCGKLVVAVEDSEMGRLEALEATARQNLVPGLRRVDAAGIRGIEPHASGLAALHSPETAITDYVAVAESLAGDIEAAGGRLRLTSPVTAIRRRGDAIEIRAGGQVHRLHRLLICAGLQADRTAALAGDADGPRIVPFRGEYLAVSREKRGLVRGMVYPVPDPRYPFLGVHFTRRVTGDVEVGPNAVLALEREGQRRSAFSYADAQDIFGWPGFWRMARAHWRTGVEEVWGSLSKRGYMQKASRYIPEIRPEDVIRSRFGVRAQAVDRDGSLVDDFRITEEEGIVSIRNAPSPGATSSLAIAEFVLEHFVKGV